jgi:hypothetical protein
MLVELHFNKIFQFIAVHKIKFLSYTKRVHYKQSVKYKPLNKALGAKTVL